MPEVHQLHPTTQDFSLPASHNAPMCSLRVPGAPQLALGRDADLLSRKAADIATAKPVVAHPGHSLGDAARLMEDRPSQISLLPVTDPATGKALGLVRIHDVYQAGIV